MSVQQYLCIVICLVGLGIATVGEHVDRVGVGYEIRRLKNDLRRLRQERKARRLMWEQMAAAEAVARRAVRLGVITRTELEALHLTEVQDLERR